MKQLRAGIIGLGVGEAHVEGYHAHPACRVTAVCDLLDAQLDKVRQKHPTIEVFSKDPEALLRDPQIDVISIASYDDAHFPQIISALEHGKHVFVEKPLCLYQNEARKILDLLDRNQKLKISSNLILRECPRFRRVREMVQAGEFGNLYYLQGDYNYGRIQKITEGWRAEIDFYSIVYGGAIHLIDLLQWISGQRVTEVRALGSKMTTKDSKFRFNDLAVALLSFDGGLLAKVGANFGCVMPHFHKLEIYGTAATFENRQDSGLVWTSRETAVAPVIMNEPYPGVRKGDLLKDFIEAIVNDRQPLVSKREMFDTMSICFAIEESIHSGTAVPVHYFPVQE